MAGHHGAQEHGSPSMNIL